MLNGAFNWLPWNRKRVGDVTAAITGRARLCKNCKHFRTHLVYKISRIVTFGADHSWAEYGKCYHPNITRPSSTTNLVSGKTEVKLRYKDGSYCSITRGEDNQCGEKGDWYE